VHSAAGGVGGALVQLARTAGHRAVAVVGAPHKLEVARELGADEVIDKSAEPLWSAARRHSPGGYDAIFDANGYRTLRQSYRNLAPEGRLVVYGFHSMLPRKGGRPNRLRLALDYLRTPRFNPFDLSQRNRGVLGFNLSFLFHRADLLAHAMADLLRLADAGTLRKPRLTSYPMARVADAHRAIESAQTVGKLVLLP
jgi:NADPH:quinone reductase-like Zn-dependent oxidoreductase